MFGFPSVVRFSWATARQLLQAKAYAVTWHDSLDEDDAANGRTTIDARLQRLEQFMAVATVHRASGGQAVQAACGRERFHYFQQRQLDVVSVFT